MYQCSKNLVTCKQHCYFDHSDFRHIQCLHLMYAEVAWVLVSSGTQVKPQVILDPDYFPDYLSISYDYGFFDESLDMEVVIEAENITVSTVMKGSSKSYMYAQFAQKFTKQICFM